MQIEENKNLVAATIGFFLIVLIAAITIYRSQQPNDVAQIAEPTNNQPADTASEKKPYELSSIELADKINSPAALIVIDTRAPEDFKQEHILDSRNIPLEKMLLELPKLDKNKSYVIVDDGTMSGLSLVTEIFPKNNFRNVSYLDGGFPAWKNQNNPTISLGDPQSFVDQSKVSYLKSDQLKNLLASETNLVIVDLRSSDHFKEGHLPGAINIFIDDIEKKRKQLPIGKKIILYDRDGLWAFQGAVRLFEMGVFNVFCLSDGLDGWQKNNFPLTK